MWQKLLHTVQQGHPWAVADFTLLKLLLKNKALIPHLKCNRAKLYMEIYIYIFFAPSKWSPCPVVLMSPSTFIFIILYCFRSFQNVFKMFFKMSFLISSSHCHPALTWLTLWGWPKEFQSLSCWPQQEHQVVMKGPECWRTGASIAISPFH